MRKKKLKIIFLILVIAITFSGLFFLLNYFHYKSIRGPSFLYYTGLLYWQNGDHRTRIYSYNPNTNQEKEILVLPTTINIALRSNDDIKISPNRQKIAYVLTKETEPGMGSSRMVESNLYISNIDGTDTKLVYTTTDGRYIPFWYWSRDSLSIKFITSLYAPLIFNQYSLKDNITKVISEQEYKTEEPLEVNNTFLRSKRLLSFEIPFLPKDKLALTRKIDSNDHALSFLLTDVDSNKSKVIKKLNDNYGYLGPISSDGNYFLYRPGNDSNGYQIQRGIELYFMNGILLARAPFRYFSEFIGFIN